MQPGFYRVELREDGKKDSFTLFVPLNANAELDSQGAEPPFLFKALWDGEIWTGEFEPDEDSKQNQLVWLGGGTEGGECGTDLLKAPLRVDSLVSIFTNEGRRTFRVTAIRIVK